MLISFHLSLYQDYHVISYDFTSYPVHCKHIIPNVQTSFATSTHHHVLVAPLNSALPLVPHQHPESPLNGAQAQRNKCRFFDGKIGHQSWMKRDMVG